MSELIIASAQTRPNNEDIIANLNDHDRLVRLAAENGASLIVFPENVYDRVCKGIGANACIYGK